MKRQEVWNNLHKNIGTKRTRKEARKNTKGSSPHEIIVQRLASEADNKQTYKPIQPREFVQYDYEEFTLANLKKACADHFNLPASTCDILVSNKGPSCTNIAQIPHRKDKVYLVRFVVLKDQRDLGADSGEESDIEKEVDLCCPKSKQHNKKTASLANCASTSFPPSVSIASLLEAGKLVKPKPKKKVTLTFEEFELTTKKWIEVNKEEVNVDTQKFSSGAFRNAFHAISCQDRKHWVLKTYNATTVETIEEKLKLTVENHCRKQVQMHAVARHLAKTFQSKAPEEFGHCFQYNSCFYTTFDGQPATIEGFVPGTFAKFINNDGECMEPAEDSSPDVKELYAKAQCLVHFTHQFSEGKLMVTDIQGSNYHLYDPEISSSDIVDGESEELYFCCGNLSTIGIDNFLESHICNDFCKLMGLKENKSNK